VHNNPAAKELQQRGRDFVGALGDHDLAQPLPDGYYLRRLTHEFPSDFWDETGNDCNAWARLVANLLAEPSLNGIPFFFLLGFQKPTGKAIKSSVVANRFSLRRQPIRGFSLRAGERYRMRVVEWSEPQATTPRPQVRIKCDFNDSQLQLEGAFDLVVGRYDVIEFTFLAAQRGYSEIALRAEPTADAQVRVASREGPGGDANGGSQESVAPWASWPSVFVARVPIAVKYRAREYVLPVISSLAGAYLYLSVAPTVNANLKPITELAGLGLLLIGFRGLTDVLEGLFKLGASLKKLKTGPSAWSE
jgi:hypothetical protein